MLNLAEAGTKQPRKWTDEPQFSYLTGVIITILDLECKGPGKRRHIVEDTLLPTQMFPRLPGLATFVADTNFVSATQNVASRVFARPRMKHHEQQCVCNNVSATMCPRFPGP